MTIAVYDTSPGPGGSITSLGALVPLLQAHGLPVRIFSTHQKHWEDQGLGPLVTKLQGPPFATLRGTHFVAHELRQFQALLLPLSRHRPKVLLANNGPLDNAALYLMAALIRRPLFQYLRAPFWVSPTSRALLARSRHVFAVGSETVHCIERTSLRPEHWSRVDEGLRADDWPSPRTPDANQWLWCGVNKTWKGLPLFLDAYEKCSFGKPDSSVCFMQLPASHHEALAPPQCANPHVHFFEAPEDLDAIRKRCNVYVHTALEPEPFGRTILEAMAAGLCPVVPDCGSGPELVEHEKTGLIYARGDQGSLTHTMQRLIDTPQLPAQLGNAAAQEAKRFEAERVFRPIIERLARACEKR